MGYWPREDTLEIPDQIFRKAKGDCQFSGNSRCVST